MKRVDNGEKLVYNCNAIQTWYITLVAFFTLQFTGIFDFAIIIENLAPLTVTAVIFADVVAIIAYLSCVFSKNQYNPSGNTIYDFFIGVWLHPRIGKDVLFFHFFFFLIFFFQKELWTWKCSLKLDGLGSFYSVWPFPLQPIKTKRKKKT